MPLIERIKQLLNMGAAVDYFYQPQGGIILNSEASTDLERFFVQPLRICFRFSVGDIVLDDLGRKYTITRIFSKVGKNTYHAKASNGKIFKFSEGKLTKLGCPITNPFCLPEINEIEIFRQESELALLRLEQAEDDLFNN